MRDSGQALVEFALLAPVLLLLVVGMIEFARAWNIYHVATDAAREGARLAVVANPTVTEDSVRAAIRNALARAAIDPDGATIELTGVEGATGTPARVEVELPFHFVFLQPLLNWADDEALVTISTDFVMRNE